LVRRETGCCADPGTALWLVRRRRIRGARRGELRRESCRGEYFLRQASPDAGGLRYRGRVRLSVGGKIPANAKRKYAATTSQAPSVPPRRRAMSAVMRSQLSVSASNCLRPARVSE